ncbi:hypothetical protein ABIB85_000276 [Bradyrhizobium sp. JR1.5]|jgi:hypothetical protein|nr:hypothetical protein Bra1253DRAFT_07657 [Bradyrhizobium sp. WSM1253]
MARALADEREIAYVSTGHLSAPEIVQALVNEAQRRFQSIATEQTRRSTLRSPAFRASCSGSASSEPADRSRRRRGLIILTGFPLTGLWVLGLLLGIDLLSHGIGWLSLAWRPAAAAA